MIAALAMVAGTAKAQLNQKTVIEGGTYSYSLSNVKVNTAAGSSVTIAVPSGTVSSISHGGTPIASSGDALPSNNNGTLLFSVTYGGTGGNINVTVTDGGSNNCSNNILLAIIVEPAPTVDITIADVAANCQDKGVATDEADAVSASTGNTLGFVTTVNMTNIPAAYSGTATITLSGTGTTEPLTGITISGLASAVTGFSYSGSGLTGTLSWDETASFDGSGNASLTFNVTFTTTEGTDDLALALTASAVSVTATSGGQTYPENAGVTGDNEGSTTVYAMPSIGAWE